MENKVKLSGVVRYSDRKKRGNLTVDTYFIKVVDESRKPGEDGIQPTFSVKAELLAPQKNQVLFKKESEVLITGKIFTNRWLTKGVEIKNAESKDWHSETFIKIDTIIDNSEPF